MTIITDNTTDTVRETEFDNNIVRKEYFNETGQTFMIDWFQNNVQLQGCTMKLEREFYQLRQVEKIQ